jgi:hypothetical protein
VFNHINSSGVCGNTVCIQCFTEYRTGAPSATPTSFPTVDETAPVTIIVAQACEETSLANTDVVGAVRDGLVESNLDPSILISVVVHCGSSYILDSVISSKAAAEALETSIDAEMFKVTINGVETTATRVRNNNVRDADSESDSDADGTTPVFVAGAVVAAVVASAILCVYFQRKKDAAAKAADPVPVKTKQPIAATRRDSFAVQIEHSCRTE